MRSQYTLANGLRIIHEDILSKVTYCGFAINAGTRDELEHEQGMAHFVEHLIFKGTQKRKAWHILNRMENVGGDLNAFTNKEETIIYSAFLNEHFERALELLADIVFHSIFPPHEIEKEVDVIIDEIQSYEDSPSELIFDDFEDMLFRNHPLGRNILGKPELLKCFTDKDALSFTSRFYRPSNMVFFVLGNIDFKKIVHQAEKFLGSVPDVKTDDRRIPPPPYVPEHLTLHKDTHQAHVMIGCRGYHAYDDKRTGLYLLNNIVGGPGMNSRLNITLRERRGLVYNVESNITPYTDTGVFCIYFGSA
ncbi:putative zinc protease, partial [termite gut metagenome]